MYKIDIQEQLKDLITRNTGEVLQVLRKIFDNNKDRLNEVVLLLARFYKYRASLRKNLLTHQQEALEFSWINDKVLELVDLISEEEAAAYELEQSIFQRILVVCKSPTREEYLENLFPSNYYKELKVEGSGVPLPMEEANAFDLIIFDNHPPGEKDDPNELLKHYLDNTTPYILYFGPNLPLLYQYPERAYFTNSVFSIHARIREMIEYLKHSQSV